MEQTEFSTFPRAFGRNESVSVPLSCEGDASLTSRDAVKNGAVTINGQEYTRLMGYVDGMWQVKIKDGVVIQFIFLQSDVSIPETVATFDLLATHVYYDAELNQILSPPEKVKVKLLTVWTDWTDWTHENKDPTNITIPKSHDAKTVKWVKLDTRSAEARNDLIRGFSEFSPVAAILQSPYEWMRTMRRSVKYARRGIFINPHDKYTWAVVATGLRRNASQMRYAFDWSKFKQDWNEMAASMPMWMIPVLETVPNGGVDYVNGKFQVVDEITINDAFKFKDIQCTEVNKIREYLAKDPHNIVIFDRKTTNPELHNVMALAQTYVKNIISQSTMKNSLIPVHIVKACKELEVPGLTLDAFEEKLMNIAKETSDGKVDSYAFKVKTHGVAKDGLQFFKDVLSLFKKRLLIYEIQDDFERVGRIDPLQREVFRLLCPAAENAANAKGGRIGKKHVAVQ